MSPNIQNAVENEISIHQNLSFVTEQAPPVDDRNIPAYKIEGPDGYILAVEEGTPVAPELRDGSGNKLDGSTRVILQKADRQENPLGKSIIFDESLSALDYNKMRADPDYFKRTTRDVLINENQYLMVYVVVPSGANQMDTGNSRITIAEETTKAGKPAFIREKDALSSTELNAVENKSAGTR